MSAAISLSGLGKGTALALLIAGVGTVSYREAPALAEYLTRARVSTGRDLRTEKRLIVYSISQQRPSVFRFSRSLRHFRMVTSAAIGAGRQQPADGWRYGLRVEVLGSDGAVIESHVIHLRASLPENNSNSGQPVYFFRTGNERLTFQDEFRFVPRLPAVAVRVSALASDPGVTAIQLRVSERRPFLGVNALASFRRRNHEEQVELARANAFPPEMLAPAEQASIAANQWRSVGPIGIEGRDYGLRVMYVSDDARQKQGAGQKQSAGQKQNGGE